MYIGDGQTERTIHFLGDSRDVVKSFPEPARQRMGYQFGLVQVGEMPDDFKPMHGVGAGVYKVRVATGGRAFRSFLVAKLNESVYVLHAFEKTSRKTASSDIAKG